MEKTIKTFVSALLLTITFYSSCFSQNDKCIEVSVNKNVELLGFVYFLGFEGPNSDNQTIEINGKLIPQKEWHAYGFDFYKKYESFAGSENLASAFAVVDHLWLDYLINLLLQVEEFPKAKASLLPTIEERYYINFSMRGDANEAKKNVAIFLEGLNQFYIEVNFDNYLAESRECYNNALAQVRDNLPQTGFIDMMEKFYRKEFDRYTLIPSLTIPKGMGFGVKYPSTGKVKIYNVFGAFDFQYFKDTSELDMGFGNKTRLRELSTHEFGHSFVNSELDQVPQEFIDATEVLFDPVKIAMENQGYNNWKVCLYEHFVRAGEVMIARNLGNMEDASKLEKQYIETRKFIYLPIILKELEKYNLSKEMSYEKAVAKIIEKLKNIANSR